MQRRPSDYPPPVRVNEFVAAPEAAEDERTDVGVLFVGGGPAGLAGRSGSPSCWLTTRPRPRHWVRCRWRCWTRAVAGAHLLSGAVVNPSALRDLFPRRRSSSCRASPVRKESVFDA